MTSIFAMLGFAMLPVDMALARLFDQDVTPGELRAIFHRAEAFGHFYGVVAVGVTVWLLDLRNRRIVATLLVAAIGSGLAADATKLLIGRIRPCHCDLRMTVWSSFDRVAFVGSSPIDVLFDSSRHSFPSAHTAMAVAMAVVLGKVYPNGRIWFGTLAFFVSMNRVDGGAHFASDVCWGAALGAWISVTCLRSQRLAIASTNLSGGAQHAEPVSFKIAA